jgi:hypothetical protein
VNKAYCNLRKKSKGNSRSSHQGVMIYNLITKKQSPVASLPLERSLPVVPWCRLQQQRTAPARGVSASGGGQKQRRRAEHRSTMDSHVTCHGVTHAEGRRRREWRIGIRTHASGTGGTAGEEERSSCGWGLGRNESPPSRP